MSVGGDAPRRRPDRLRVAFSPMGGAGWLGGLHYLTALLSALSEHAAAEVEAVLLVPPGIDGDVVAELRPFLHRDPVVLPSGGSRGQALASTVGDGLHRRDRRVEAVCRAAGVDLVFQHAGWLGSSFGLPTLAWLGDFQHRALPGMFTRPQRWKREARFQEVLRSASLLYVLSEADLALGASLYPRFTPKMRALPFAVGVPDEARAGDPAEVRARYGLPPKFFLLPGQHWRHKNHLGVIDAVARMKGEGPEVLIAMCGNPVDHRDPRHGPRVRSRVAELGLEQQVRMLGLLPRRDMWGLLRASAAVVNPSLYEGWSTPVEEAKSIGAPLVLSDLAVHREQRPPNAAFFDPRRPASMAEVLGATWSTTEAGPRPAAERRAAEALGPRRRAFARGFVDLAREAAALR